MPLPPDQALGRLRILLRRAERLRDEAAARREEERVRHLLACEALRSAYAARVSALGYCPACEIPLAECGCAGVWV